MTEQKTVETKMETAGVKKRNRPVIDKDTCAGCSLCVENCPMNCLQIEAPKFHGDIHTVAILTWPEQCTGCGICAKNCPIRAIEMKEGN